MSMPTYYEFFAGGGMARAGLGPGWECLFANDFDPKKASSYAENWGAADLLVGDVGAISPAALPDRADLAWASFPCQDLSLAGAGAGLNGSRSGAFWEFWRLMRALTTEGRAPTTIVLENVRGALTSHGGRDFAAIGEALAAAGYCFGALLIDAVHFVPQSRARLFIIAIRADHPIPDDLMADGPDPLWAPGAVIDAFAGLSARARAAARWWRLPLPPPRTTTLVDLIEPQPVSVSWRNHDETLRLLDLMAPLHLAKVEAARRSSMPQIGSLYKRIRTNGNGDRSQRAEVRFDGVAGCLRTSLGGSSRQSLLFVEGDSVRSRLLSTREAARLMGLPDSYNLPPRYNQAYHLLGDGVVVPVVRHLAARLLEPLAASRQVTEELGTIFPSS
jgi:DNA (cytosine-5)-methyltransferase 1